jgi:alanine-glyoxylate transaminase/serine-glyoxylate transaminase/serine-pyruvate transaminase
MSGRNFLFVPGPTNVPDRILRAMHRAQDDHRNATYPAFVKGLLADLPKVFGSTKGQGFILPSSGTGAWETALVNSMSPGDKVVAVRNGQFGALFIDMAQRHGLNVDLIEAEWGMPAPVNVIAEKLAADKAHEIKGVLVVHNETSTGVTSDVAGVRKALDAAKHPALLLVDGVSSIGSLDYGHDEWGVDFSIAGSQKGFMMPAGLGLLCVSPKGLASVDKAKCSRVFFDLRDHMKQNPDGWFPYTPAGAHLHGLREALDMLLEEGMANVAKRHHRLGEGVRRAVKAWNLCLCAKDPATYSNTVSAVVVPSGADAEEVRALAFKRYNLALGAGLGPLRGKVFRIGHLGDLNDLMLLGALGGVEMVLKDVGVDITLGSGVAAAAEWYRSTAS